jgi:hypothetical protein
MVILSDVISVVAVLCHEYITAEPETHIGGWRWCIREGGNGRWLIRAFILEWWMRIVDTSMVVVDEVDPLVHGAKARGTTQHATRRGHTFEK